MTDAMRSEYAGPVIATGFNGYSTTAPDTLKDAVAYAPRTSSSSVSVALATRSSNPLAPAAHARAISVFDLLDEESTADRQFGIRCRDLRMEWNAVDQALADMIGSA
jgi:hypothetical protein